jgi:hypothetical protein
MFGYRWLTLTDFVKYLGREGFCKVDQTEKGWFLVYQKKEIEAELVEERKKKRHKAEKVRMRGRVGGEDEGGENPGTCGR